jgi:hypothetical protein
MTELLAVLASNGADVETTAEGRVKWMELRVEVLKSQEARARKRVEAGAENAAASLLARAARPAAVVTGDVEAQVIAATVVQERNPGRLPPARPVKVVTDHRDQDPLRFQHGPDGDEHIVGVDALVAAVSLPVLPLVEGAEGVRHVEPECGAEGIPFRVAQSGLQGGMVRGSQLPEQRVEPRQRLGHRRRDGRRTNHPGKQFLQPPSGVRVGRHATPPQRTRGTYVPRSPADR